MPHSVFSGKVIRISLKSMVTETLLNCFGSPLELGFVNKTGSSSQTGATGFWDCGKDGALQEMRYE